MLVDTGNLDTSARHSRSSVSSDLQLGAGIVEFSLAVVSAVKTNVFATDEVLAVGDSRGDSEVDVIFAVAAPRASPKRLGVARLAEQGLGDLVPGAGAFIGGGIADRAHVDLGGARMKHTGATEGLLKANLVAGLDGEDLCGRRGALVAGEVGISRRDRAGRDILELGGHIAVLILANVGVVTTLSTTVDEELVKRVVSRGRGSQAEDGGENDSGLHNCD